MLSQDEPWKRMEQGFFWGFFERGPRKRKRGQASSQKKKRDNRKEKQGERWRECNMSSACQCRGSFLGKQKRKNTSIDRGFCLHTTVVPKWAPGRPSNGERVQPAGGRGPVWSIPHTSTAMWCNKLEGGGETGVPGPVRYIKAR